MCDTLAELEDGMRGYAAAFNAGRLSTEQVAMALKGAVVIERLAATVKALAAARVADTKAWKAAGDRSAAHHLARSAGTAVGQARKVIDTARRLHALPALAAAARSGRLSAQQAAAVADAATADPRSEQRLVDLAQRCSVGELHEECARTKAAADPDAEARRRRIHDRRYLRTHTDAEGAWHLHMRDNPEVGAEVMAAIEPIADRLSEAARARGSPEPSEAYAADALAALARGGEAAGPARARAKTMVRVDLGALLRGRAVEGEVCEIAGFGPVAVSAVRDLLDTGDPFLAAVVADGHQVLGVAHLGRRPTAHQQTALEWLYPSCAVEGCSASTWLENDHRVDWAASHMTVLDLLDRLCSHHHRLKSREDWALVQGRGKRPFVPPDDARHPRHANAPRAAA